MPKKPVELFQIRYDWDTGSWRVEVQGLRGQLLAWKAYKTSEEADEGLVALRQLLCMAPKGNPVAVLIMWADWVEPKLLPPS